MSADLDKILQQVLQLPPEARGALAAQLLDSLDQSVDDSAQEAWDREIQHRVEELDRGRVKTIPWSEVCRTLNQP